MLARLSVWSLECGHNASILIASQKELNHICRATKTIVYSAKQNIRCLNGPLFQGRFSYKFYYCHVPKGERGVDGGENRSKSRKLF